MKTAVARRMFRERLTFSLLSEGIMKDMTFSSPITNIGSSMLRVEKNGKRVTEWGSKKRECERKKFNEASITSEKISIQKLHC